MKQKKFQKNSFSRIFLTRIWANMPLTYDLSKSFIFQARDFKFWLQVDLNFDPNFYFLVHGESLLFPAFFSHFRKTLCI